MSARLLVAVAVTLVAVIATYRFSGDRTREAIFEFAGFALWMALAMGVAGSFVALWIWGLS